MSGLQPALARSALTASTICWANWAAVPVAGVPATGALCVAGLVGLGAVGTAGALLAGIAGAPLVGLACAFRTVGVALGMLVVGGGVDGFAVGVAVALAVAVAVTAQLGVLVGWAEETNVTPGPGDNTPAAADGEAAPPPEDAAAASTPPVTATSPTAPATAAFPRGRAALRRPRPRSCRAIPERPPPAASGSDATASITTVSNSLLMDPPSLLVDASFTPTPRRPTNRASITKSEKRFSHSNSAPSARPLFRRQIRDDAPGQGDEERTAEWRRTVCPVTPRGSGRADAVAVGGDLLAGRWLDG
ncbi:hypothetical protein [Kitasatospora sp. NPDC001683]